MYNISITIIFTRRHKRIVIYLDVRIVHVRVVRRVFFFSFFFFFLRPERAISSRPTRHDTYAVSRTGRRSRHRRGGSRAMHNVDIVIIIIRCTGGGTTIILIRFLLFFFSRRLLIFNHVYCFFFFTCQF